MTLLIALPALVVVFIIRARAQRMAPNQRLRGAYRWTAVALTIIETALIIYTHHQYNWFTGGGILSTTVMIFVIFAIVFG